MSLVLLSGVGYVEDNRKNGRCVDFRCVGSCDVEDPPWEPVAGCHLQHDLGLGSKSKAASSKVSDAGYSLSSIPIETLWGMPTAFATLGSCVGWIKLLLTLGRGAVVVVVCGEH